MKKMALREQREENILLSLRKLNYLTRSQLQAIHRLGTARNASRFMKRLQDQGYVSSFRDGENVYYLNQEGRERVGATKVCKKTAQARHHIMRNSAFIAFGSPMSWKAEMKLEVPGEVRIIADALFLKDKRYHIVEVDHQQKMSANRAKVKKYRRLMELSVFEQPPVFIWVTTTEFRRKQLLRICEGLDVHVFTITDFH
jgi:DNA-binding PadR family transcriptional regulator